MLSSVDILVENYKCHTTSKQLVKNTCLSERVITSVQVIFDGSLNRHDFNS